MLVVGTHSLQIVTTRAVRAGEELTIAYIETDAPRSSRRAKLASGYHFECGCARCSTESAEGKKPPGAGQREGGETKRQQQRGGRQPQKRTKAEQRARREERKAQAAAKAAQRKAAAQPPQSEPEPEPEPEPE